MGGEGTSPHSTKRGRKVGMDYHFEDFTETHYRQLLRQVKSHWKCISFTQTEETQPCCLWRHDVDYSLHRSLRLAQIEHEEGITSTYFLYPHCEFYHLFDRTSFHLVEEILRLGHQIGLHFDPNFYTQHRSASPHLQKELLLEKNLLEATWGRPIEAFSFHNPAQGNWHLHSDHFFQRMVSAYSPAIREKFAYCSDSNGYWRFQRLADFLHQTEHKYIQVLTHPAWWTPEVMSPRQRIERCLQGRAHVTAAHYEQALKEDGRLNVC